MVAPLNDSQGLLLLPSTRIVREKQVLLPRAKEVYSGLASYPCTVVVFIDVVAQSDVR